MSESASKWRVSHKLKLDFTSHPDPLQFFLTLAINLYF